MSAITARVVNLDELKLDRFDRGGDYYRRHGVMMPEDGHDALRDKDAILFGSAGQCQVQHDHSQRLNPVMHSLAVE